MSQFHEDFIVTVIEHYGLELDDRQVDSIMVNWCQTYEPIWIIKAIVESLYRGRYKIKSIDNILKDWQRLGSPLYKFTPDYERQILQSLQARTDLLAVTPLDRQLEDLSCLNTENLNPEELKPFLYYNQSTQPIDVILEDLE